MRLIIALLITTTTAAACGDNLGSGGDAPDAGAPDGQLGAATAFAVAPDYENGVGIASTIEIPSLAVETNVVAGAISSDPAVRVIGDRIYVINRFGFDNITILERDGFALVEQVSTGANTNPQDVARAGGKLYVAAHDSPGLLIIDEADLAAGVAGTIDLSALDPADGDPDCTSVVEVGDLIVVACGVLDESFTPRGPGAIAVIDPDTDTVTTTFELTHANPLSFLVTADPTGPLAADVLVATAPSFSDYSSGCIERIGIGAAPAPLGCLVDNSELGGYVSALAVVDDGLVATVNTCVDGDCFTTPTVAKLVPISPSGEVGAPLSGPSSHVTDVVRCPNGAMVASDTDFADEPGIRVFHDGAELTTGPLAIGLPPAFVNGLACY
jgi:hypothetical protein